MILPKMSAALLSMSFFGSAYASSELHRDTSLEQWVVICGAANGAAAAFDVTSEDLQLHRRTAQEHLTRYAVEHGVNELEFGPLFERGQLEGKTLVANHSALFVPRHTALLNGFHHDKTISYDRVVQALAG